MLLEHQVHRAWKAQQTSTPPFLPRVKRTVIQLLDLYIFIGMR